MYEKICLTDLIEGVHHLKVQDFSTRRDWYPNKTGLRVGSCEQFTSLSPRQFHNNAIKLVNPPRFGSAERACTPSSGIKSINCIKIH